MTRAEIEAALKLCEAATPGPWESSEFRSDFDTFTVTAGNRKGGRICRVWDKRTAARENMRFIVEARTLLPAALNALLRAMPVLEAAREQARYDTAAREAAEQRQWEESRAADDAWLISTQGTEAAIREHDREAL